jgi:hypothetical protein
MPSLKTSSFTKTIISISDSTEFSFLAYIIK